jgi:hypothetical protein
VVVVEVKTIDMFTVMNSMTVFLDRFLMGVIIFVV